MTQHFLHLSSIYAPFSDARSGTVVDERIRPALESGSAVGSSKPVLVVIDEIDGATGAGDTVRFSDTYDDPFLMLCKV